MNRNQPVKTLVDKIWNDQSYGNSIKQNVAFIDILQENRLDLFMIGKSYFFLSFRNYKNEKKKAFNSNLVSGWCDVKNIIEGVNRSIKNGWI